MKRKRLPNIVRLMAADARLHGRMARISRRYSDVVGACLTGGGIAVYVASAAVVTGLVLYGGFDSSTLDRHLLMRGFHIAQGLFIAYILFNIIFGFKSWWRDSLFVKRIAAGLMLLTLIPVIFPHTAGTPVDSIWHFLHSRWFLFTGLGVYSLAELCYGTMQMLGRRTNPSLILSASFLIFIILGSFVLMMPRCTTGGIRYIDALFMAASAVSMTGLCTVDIAASFTPLGQTVMIVLMQIGALGVLTFTSFFALFFSGRASIYNQILMRDFIYSKSISSLMPVILYILTFTLCVEGIGALGIYLTLPDGFGGSTGQRAFFAVFHSVSAFCNAGFTTLPQGMAEPALMDSNQAIYLVLSALILAGGLGFPNLVNIKEAAGEYIGRLRCSITGRRRRHRAHIYDINTKLVLLWSAVFFAVGCVAFYVLEYNHSMAGLSWSRRAIQSIFCSCTVRTAGFSTYGPDQWLGATLLIAMFFMWVGCASQSMGGGIKVNTFATVVLNIRALARGQKGITAFNRTIAPDSVRRAYAVVCLSGFAILGYSLLLTLLQPELPLKGVMFEAFSAFTTIGMSLGITPELSDASKIVVATAMFLGRVGVISVLCGLVGNRTDRSPMLPTDDVIIN
ncbi:MAG: potassium transporter [Muribaculaceae bacterium]|nr:potassium transporter [Muribaculaceae bacterium]